LESDRDQLSAGAGEAGGIVAGQRPEIER
jgi:hypothetical protein